VSLSFKTIQKSYISEGGAIVFNVTFNNISVISWQLLLLVKEIGVPGENHPPVASHWQFLSHNVLSNLLYHCMYSVYVLDILFKRVVQAPCAIPDGQHFIYMWTTLPLYHHFTKTGGLSVADPGEGGRPPL
jgi:hypothetical protein